MKTETTLPTKTRKINLVCVCGKTLSVIPNHDEDLKDVAKSQCWRIISVVLKCECAALCPTCNYATTRIEHYEAEACKRD